MKRWTAAALVVAVTSLAGCSSSGHESAPSGPSGASATTTASSSVTTTASPTASTSTAAGPSATAAPTAPPTGKGLGSARRAAGAAVTVYAVREDGAPSAPVENDAMRWAAADVRFCWSASQRQAAGLSWEPWQLVGVDGSRYPASTRTYDGFPRPEYPVSEKATLRPGRCARGWVVFEIPRTAHVAGVRFASDALGTVLTWSVR